MQPITSAAVMSIAVIAGPGATASPDAGGCQFTTTDGAHCRIMTITRWQSPPTADCWGSLPGVTGTTNYAFAKGPWFGPQDDARLGLGSRTLDNLETYRSYEQRSGPTADNVNPASYRVLPTGSKIIIPEDGSVVTCGIPHEHTSVCTLAGPSDNGPWRCGFIVSPQGKSAL